MILKPTVSFWGKNKVQDNDHITVSEISGKKNEHDIAISIAKGSKYVFGTFDSYGVVWSSTPGVTIENGMQATKTNDSYDESLGELRHYQIANDSLDYDTEYYYRAYVRKYGLTYYSEEKSHTFYQE
jgi:hypothetical protein